MKSRRLLSRFLLEKARSLEKLTKFHLHPDVFEVMWEVLAYHLGQLLRLMNPAPM